MFDFSYHEKKSKTLSEIELYYAARRALNASKKMQIIGNTEKEAEYNAEMNIYYEEMKKRCI